MAHQIIIENIHKPDLKKSLCDIWEEIEVFDVCEDKTGISIPTKVLDSNSEEEIMSKVKSYRHYDLWQGKWQE